MHLTRNSTHAAMAALLLAAGATHAIDASWTGGNGIWSDATQWSTNPDIPAQTDDIARLGGTSTGVQTTLDQPDVVIGQLINLRNTGWTINKHAEAYPLGFAVTTGSALIHAQSAQTVNLTVHPDVTIASDLIVRSQRQDAQSQNVTLNGTLTGTGNVTLDFTGSGNNARGNITLASLGTTGTLTVQGNNSANGPMTATVGPISSGVTTLTKTGTSRLFLTGANSYTGDTTVNGGILRAVDGTSLTSSLLTLDGGAFETSADFVRALGSDSNNVRIPGGASGFSAFGGPVAISLGGLASPASLTWGSADFAPTTLILNAGTAMDTLEFRNAIDLGTATRTVQVNTNVVTLAGVLSNSSGTAGLTKTGNGTLILANAANSYNGTTSVNAGVLRANDGAALPSTSNLTLAGGVLEGSADIVRNGGSLAGEVRLTSANSGFSAFGAPVTVAIGGLASPTALTWGTAPFNPNGPLVLNAVTANDTLELKNAINLGSSGTNTRTIRTDANVATVSGDLTAAGGTQNLTKTGAGTLVLTGVNTYTGTTTVGAGVLRADDGSSLPATGNLTLGIADSTAGVFETSKDMTRNGGTGPGEVRIIRSSGFSAYGADVVVAIGGTESPTPLLWNTAPFSVPNGGTFVLNAPSANAHLDFRNPLASGVNQGMTVRVDASVATMSGVVSSGGGSGLAKVGNGTLVLANDNTYQGSTTVSVGSLLVNGSLDARASTVTANAGATLGGSGTISRSVTVAGTLAPGGLATPGALSVDLGATTGKITLNSGATLAYKFVDGASDTLRVLNAVAGDMVLNSNTIDFAVTGALPAGPHTLMAFYSDGGTTLTNNGKPTSGLVIGAGLDSRPGCTLDYTATGLVQLIVPASPGTIMLIR